MLTGGIVVGMQVFEVLCRLKISVAERKIF